MIYGSVCSGIEAASVAWHPLGWKPAFFSEIEKFPSAVLAQHYPDVPNHGDMTKFKEWPNAIIDVLVGGTPCQSFSVAGLRKGLDDPRGNLMLTYLAIADRYRPKWVVWENVPGVLSSNGGRDFGTFLGALGQLGYGFAYRVLDAQYFGVPQRRRRVFVVGCLGNWRAAAAVLFERHSLQGHPAPRREARKETAGTLASRTTGGGFPGTDEACEGHDASEDGTGRGVPLVFDPTQITSPDNHANPKPGAPCHTLNAHSKEPVICFDSKASATHMPVPQEGIAQTLRSMSGKRDNGGGQLAMLQGRTVRRLTPIECERLQGFPDNYTRIPWRNKAPEDCPDGPRYKSLGNSMAVPVMEWLGRRIELVEGIRAEVSAAA